MNKNLARFICVCLLGISFNVNAETRSEDCRDLLGGDKNAPNPVSKNSRVQFPEVEVQMFDLIPFLPIDLAKYVKSQLEGVAQLEDRLFNIEENLEYWKGLTGYKYTDTPERVGKNRKRKFKEKQDERFLTFLNKFISENDRAKLRDKNVDGRVKRIILITTIKALISRTVEPLKVKQNGVTNSRTQKTSSVEEQIKKQQNKYMQIIVELIASTGFADKENQIMLKNNNGQMVINGLRHIDINRNLLIEQLGFYSRISGSKLNFDNLLKETSIASPSFTLSPTDQGKFLSRTERRIANLPGQNIRGGITKVRALTVQESAIQAQSESPPVNSQLKA